MVLIFISTSIVKRKSLINEVPAHFEDDIEIFDYIQNDSVAMMRLLMNFIHVLGVIGDIVVGWPAGLK